MFLEMDQCVPMFPDVWTVDFQHRVRKALWRAEPMLRAMKATGSPYMEEVFCELLKIHEHLTANPDPYQFRTAGM